MTLGRLRNARIVLMSGSVSQHLTRMAGSELRIQVELWPSCLYVLSHPDFLRCAGRQVMNAGTDPGDRALACSSVLFTPKCSTCCARMCASGRTKKKPERSCTERMSCQS
ncbi:hypothetical protein PV04_05856 [Phialophora macrospora]|uniref:Uncharacterized protein n=1 Tax=Phialophora macrospora TaxID=1851006 RepID=A0A0D2CMY6_9EURO|nr:hypothetical protein PV04_05856 [Phialophora macrospora]